MIILIRFRKIALNGLKYADRLGMRSVQIQADHNPDPQADENLLRERQTTAFRGWCRCVHSGPGMISESLAVVSKHHRGRALPNVSCRRRRRVGPPREGHMPSTLFDQTFAGTKKNKRPLGTVFHFDRAARDRARRARRTAALDRTRRAADHLAPECVCRRGRPAEAAAGGGDAGAREDGSEPQSDVAPTVAPSTIEPEPPGLPVAASQGVPADWMTGPTVVARRAARGRETRRRRDAGSSKRTRTCRRRHSSARAPHLRAAGVSGHRAHRARRRQGGARGDDRRMGRRQERAVRQSSPLLDKAAMDAVSKWRYAPTRLNGQPIAIVMMVTVTFTLRN